LELIGLQGPWGAFASWAFTTVNMQDESVDSQIQQELMRLFSGSDDSSSFWCILIVVILQQCIDGRFS
jgi:hypothetical protein